MKKRLLSIGVLTITATALGASTASADSVSANWAGYAASGAQFSKVSGTWVQPAASCDGSQGTAAFWVGIGGTGNEQKLEQAGTEVDCSSGSPSYTTWYELVPDAPVTTDLKVKPGDKLSATVGVDGDQVSIAMTNQTTGQSFNKTLQMDSPDTSSAEWIAEAPSICQGGALGNCQPVALADFGKVDFTNATATGDGQTGTAAQWQAESMTLSPSASGFAADTSGEAGAVPSDLNGGAFSVSVSSDGGGATQSGGDPYGDSGGDPYGYSGGGSDYGYDGGGSPYGYDGGGYGGGWGGGSDYYGYVPF
jgi:Peptidase A4 family